MLRGIMYFSCLNEMFSGSIFQTKTTLNSKLYLKLVISSVFLNAFHEICEMIGDIMIISGS